MSLLAVHGYADAGRLRELLLEDPSPGALRKLRKVYKYIYTHINVAAMACWWGRRVRSKHIPTLTQTHDRE